MIKGFKCKHTEALHGGRLAKRFSGIGEQARKRLRILDSAKMLGDLANWPSNNFEALKGDRKEHYSIRVNRQWRICFKWDDAPYDVEIVDYH